MTPHTCMLAAALFICAAAAHGQENPAAYVESDGEATITAAPNLVAFWFHFAVREATMEDAVAVAEGFDNRLNVALQEANLVPVDFELTPIAINSLEPPSVYVGARTVFSMANYAKPGEGAKLFARLCDGIRAVATKLECDLSGPVFEVNDKDGMIRQAVAAATERAFPPAESVARALKNAVWAVDTVRILEVNWNKDLIAPRPLPNIREVACTAKVRVTYSLIEE